MCRKDQKTPANSGVWLLVEKQTVKYREKSKKYQKLNLLEYPDILVSLNCSFLPA